MKLSLILVVMIGVISSVGCTEKKKSLSHNEHQLDVSREEVALLKRAQSGDAQGQFLLALLYEDSGTTGHNEQAFNWFKKAANQNHPKAQFNTAIYYASLFDDGNAFLWYKKASDNGIPEAKTNLGIMYAEARVVERDYKKAMTLWLDAASHGDPVAQSSLGVLYENGLGVKQSYQSAMKWYMKAKDQGDQRAIRRLGVMYSEGYGVERSETKANEFFDLLD
jgi:uncharacterized protein